jgi:rfaE bifunctional protein nucleotidyltransferase chain/domain
LPNFIGQKVEELKREGFKIVTLNGSFDLFHAGHLKMLTEAFDLKGDKGVVILALNSDASIKSYKSTKRPIIELEYRLKIIASSVFIDFVTWFDEDDPIRLLSIIQPDIHVNGAEYGEDCIEAQAVKNHGGRLVLVEKFDQLSTSSIIKKIQNEGIDG